MPRRAVPYGAFPRALHTLVLLREASLLSERLAGSNWALRGMHSPAVTERKELWVRALMLSEQEGVAETAASQAHHGARLLRTIAEPFVASFFPR